MNKREEANKQVKEKLMQAMIDLAETKEWTKVTITDLINHSGVARASFYRNFKCIGDLIQYGIEQIRQAYWADVPSASQDILKREMLVYTFEFYGKHKDLILSFHHSGLSVTVLEVITDSMIDAYGDMPANSIQKYELYYYSGALYNTMIYWLENGLKESPYEMADVFYGLAKGSKNLI